jgi:hypothetical protein
VAELSHASTAVRGEARTGRRGMSPNRQPGEGRGHSPQRRRGRGEIQEECRSIHGRDAPFGQLRVKRAQRSSKAVTAIAGDGSAC